MTSKPRILIIDDDPDLVDTICMVLENSGLETVPAYGGREGLEKAREKGPDLIVLDIMMPDLKGYDVCRELRTDPKLSGIPIIMLTSEEDYLITADITRVKDQAVEAEDFFEKPVDPEVLVERIHELLSERPNSYL